MNIFKKIRIWERHHKIELFGIMIGILACIMAVDLASIKLYASKRDKMILDYNAIYMGEFTTSLTGVNGNISQIYVNPDRTKCVILLRFDNMSNMITDASKYQIFVKGYDVTKGRYARRTYSNPTGGYYVFGATGYAAIYLTDASGFKKEVLECVVRCNDILLANASVADEDAVERDNTYAQYDQWRVIVNPCGASAKVCDFIDDFDIVSLYQDAVIDENENYIRQTLADNIKNMQACMKKIEAYKENLISLGVNVPTLPDSILGDVIEEEEGTLIYKPKYVFENGVDFDWFHNTLQEVSFMDMVKEPDMTNVQFFNSLQDHSASLGYSGNDSWYMTDGTQIDTSSAASSIFTNMQTISENISKYQEAISDYYDIKKTYQCTNLINYLALEANMKEVGKYFTSNYSEYTVIVW